MKPKVIIPSEIVEKIRYWCHKAGKDEISGLGHAQADMDGNIRILSTLLLPQQNGSTVTDIEADAVAKAMYQTKDLPGELKWWWHSHVDMGVFWSGTDLDTIKKFGQGGWIVATVFNKKNEQKSAYFAPNAIQYPWGNAEIFHEEIETILNNVNDPKVKEWEKEFDDNVRKKYTDWGYPTVNYSRPPEISKKQWRKMQRGFYVSANPVQAIGDPFSQEERSFLAQEGYSGKDIDDFLAAGFSAMDITRMAQFGAAPWEITSLLAEKQTPYEIMKFVQGDIYATFNTSI